MLRRSRVFTSALAGARVTRSKDIEGLQEIKQLGIFRQQLKDGAFEFKTAAGAPRPLNDLVTAGVLDDAAARTAAAAVVDAAFATFALHIESRIASLLSHGFYTIGPCGEENLAPVGMVLRPTDPTALHYRHLAVAIARRLRDAKTPEERDAALREALHARARGYVVSAADPVCGGHHCALGGGEQDYIVTSTLASQTCPAVGRAIGLSLANRLLGADCPVPADAVSFVSLGDGSVNNAHFLAGVNLAEFAVHRHRKVPVVFCITDNDICISLRGDNYLKRFTKKLQMPVFEASGSDAVDTWIATQKAVSTARSQARPVALVLSDITRRFGHAATDRQGAYMPAAEIQRRADRNPLLGLCRSVVDSGMMTPSQLRDRFDWIAHECQSAFNSASQEPKIASRGEVMQWNSAPLKPAAGKDADEQGTRTLPAPQSGRGAKFHVMRKHMTAVFDELLSTTRDVVYIGEDVTHGGYYLVTDGLAKKHPMRVADFPPDETSLLGTAMGYAHVGLVPVIEIPYAKYLDCGFDMFTEACITHWLSRGQRHNGMVIRLQGFGRGVFGGNYHTHNTLYTPPGLDVVCCSNGADYSRLMRYAVQQARAGRVVMFVDSTEILNTRSVNAPGQPELSWEHSLTAADEYMDFDAVTVYDADKFAARPSRGAKHVAVVSYGNGLISSLEAQQQLHATTDMTCDVIDCRLVSSVPKGLEDALRAGGYDAIVFADPCKEGQHPLASHLTALINSGVVGRTPCRCVAAPRTYNPLGNRLTFLDAEDITKAVQHSLAV
jgi:2-oxoisovalerate dehydrogenase E1 component